MSDGPALRITGLNRTFHQGGRELKVLRDLDMTVDRGEAVALIDELAATIHQGPIYSSPQMAVR